MNLPVVHTFETDEVLPFWQAFSENPGTTLLESTLKVAGYSDYSFMGVAPFGTFSVRDGVGYWNETPCVESPFKALKQCLGQFTFVHTNLGPFYGGAMGYLGYELAQSLEDLPIHPHPDVDVPMAYLGFYDLVFVFNHITKKTHLVSSGLSVAHPEGCSIHARERLAWALSVLEKHANEHVKHPQNDTVAKTPDSCGPIISTEDRDSYIAMVEKIQEHIRAGDIFQACVSQRLQASLNRIRPQNLYEQMRLTHQAPFSGYLSIPGGALIAASPERLLQSVAGHLRTEPIKGTIRRGKTAEEDQQLAQQLSACPKNRAENIMIVDLMRNDFSKVCLPSSVVVPELCQLSSFTTVHHLISVVEGELAPGYSTVDALAACFPGGSVTGAPKIRAMELITEVEKRPRNTYCGCFGYIGFDGNMDMAMTIRTFLCMQDTVYLHVGGAVTLDSDPASEYEESCVKGLGLKKLLSGATS
ncbi:MAG: anthranilate synthase component I family protein [Pseudomonadota bacterium]